MLRIRMTLYIIRVSLLYVCIEVVRSFFRPADLREFLLFINCLSVRLSEVYFVGPYLHVYTVALNAFGMITVACYG